MWNLGGDRLIWGGFMVHLDLHVLRVCCLLPTVLMSA